MCRVTKCLRFSPSRRTVSAEYLCCGTLTWRWSIDGHICGKRWEGVGNDLGEGGQAHVLGVKDRTGVLPQKGVRYSASNPKRARMTSMPSSGGEGLGTRGKVIQREARINHFSTL
jgi:hypothetical protein